MGARQGCGLCEARKDGPLQPLHPESQSPHRGPVGALLGGPADPSPGEIPAPGARPCRPWPPAPSAFQIPSVSHLFKSKGLLCGLRTMWLRLHLQSTGRQAGHLGWGPRARYGGPPLESLMQVETHLQRAGWGLHRPGGGGRWGDS